MESKLTLKLNTLTIGRAKRYIHKHRGNSLSKLVENYFNSLTDNELDEDNKKLPPIVSSLAGIAKKDKIKNIKSDYTDYLIGKYK
jgi:Family of unknown function (DUF6364)